MNDPPSLPDQPSLPISQEEHVDRLADAFECRWKSGDRAGIEEYLLQIGPASRAALLGELVALEIEFRRGAGEVVTVDEYRRRFPDDAATVDGAFGVKISPSTYVVVSQDDTGGRPAADSQPEVMPKTLGRYEVRRVLGHGGFGMVYLGHDTQLDRPVALKIPRKASFSPARIEAFIHEARMAAQLKHPALVAVYDVQPHGDGMYIVQEYVDGRDLAHHAASRRFSHEEIVRVAIEIAEAIGFAHQRNLVHRDLKPANVLIDQEGRVHVADFGLALDEGLQRRREGEIAGTPAYMSPEQARGESHRLDGRTDLWSLGVILYELLTGRRPFAGKNRDELFDEIEHRDPKPPRMIDRAVPGELERICLRCLAKPRTLRYSSAAELVEDLRHWQEEGRGEGERRWEKGKRREGDQGREAREGRHGDAGTRGHERQPPLAKIVPKGLRSFDAHDADFFLELLPGPHDRDGLPPGVRFWKTQIEETDAERTFPVGVVWGPSGCGKSSLIRAGLLPRLASHVLSLYVEATAADTEVRLLKGLRKQCPELPADASLPEMIAQLRESRGSGGRKVLIVLDQFEQWLHAKRIEPDPQLPQALRHCDGAHVQCLVLVRDDFWLAVSRFMQGLEVSLEGENSALVDLFDLLHARKVLAEFGRAYGRLPEGLGQLSLEQAGFLDQAVAGLAQDGKIISVRLALFAEMVKGKPWTLATWKGVGGMEGVGVTFLEETFSASTAPPSHRLHQKAARAVLRALLPESGTDIKGHMRSRQECFEASGYGSRPKDFDDLIRILDAEIRLITPTDPEGKEEGKDEAHGKDEGGRMKDEAQASPDSSFILHPSSFLSHPSSFYQLTHDYLVPSLRAWLTRKQRETRRGRAELRLAERAASYALKPDPRHLPGWFEWPNILLFTRRKSRTPLELRLMRAAGRRRLAQGGMAAALIAAVIVSGLTLRKRVVDAQERTVAEGLAARLLVATLDDAVKIAEQLRPHRRYADPELQRVLAAREDEATDGRRLRAAIGLLDVDDTQAQRVYDALLAAPPDEARVLVGVLDGHKRAWVEPLWRKLGDDETPADARLRAAMALAAFDPPDAAPRRRADPLRGYPGVSPPVLNGATASARWENQAAFIVDQWLAEARHDPSQYEPLSEAFAPLANLLLAPLGAVFRDGRRNAAERELATSILARYAANNAAVLSELAVDAEGEQFLKIFPVLEKRNDTAARETLKDLVGQAPAADLKPAERVAFGKRRAGAAIALVRQGEREVIFPALRMDPGGGLRGDPEARTQFVHRCRARGVSPAELLECVKRCDALRQPITGAARQADDGVLYALLLALGEFDLAELPDIQRDPFVEQLAAWYAGDHSSAIHGAAGWLLRQWGRHELARKVDQTPVPYSPDREWFTLKFDVPNFAVPKDESGDESPHSKDESGDESPRAKDESADESPCTTDKSGDGAPAQRVVPHSKDAPPESGTTTIHMTFVVFPAGMFTIGSRAGESEGQNDETPHTVRVARPFAILDREITWAELEAFSPSRYANYRAQLNAAVEHAGTAADWYDAVRFCRWLSERAGMSEEGQAYPDPSSLDAGQFPPDPDPNAEGAPRNWPLNLRKPGFRLPTEAEWEIAARSESDTAYGFGNDVSLLDRYGWFLDNAEKHAHEPRRLRPNCRGLFDLYGNVYEWCHDWYGAYGEEVADPIGAATGSYRVARGGGWSSDAAYCRSAYRLTRRPTSRTDYLGFRVALVPFSQESESSKEGASEAGGEGRAGP